MNLGRQESLVGLSSRDESIRVAASSPKGLGMALAQEHETIRSRRVFQEVSMLRRGFLATVVMVLVAVGLSPAGGQEQLQVRISWGHTSPDTRPFYVRLVPKEATIAEAAGMELESEDRLQDVTCESKAGGGDVDGIEFVLQYASLDVKPTEAIHPFWKDLIAQSDADTAGRLQQDPAWRPDPRVLTIQMNREGTQGFSVTVDQLLRTKVFWVPACDVFIVAGDARPSFAEYQDQLAPYRGRRVLDRVQREPEASYEQYAARWEDMGSPAYKHPSQPAPGHIVGLAWEGSLYKFGIDRGAGVWSDYGAPFRYHFWFDFGDLSPGLADAWKGQRLIDGLPVIATSVERDGLHYEVEQFAYPVNGPPQERRGDMPMALLQKIIVTRTQRGGGQLSVKMHYRRETTADDAFGLTARREGSASVFAEGPGNRALLVIDGANQVTTCRMVDEQAGPPRGEKEKPWKNYEFVVSFGLAEKGSKEFVVTLASPPVEPEDTEAFLKLDYARARQETLAFWSDWVRRGAQFEVAEKAVNDLLRVSLWHALRLPRRHGGSEKGVEIDLPYSNFAYDQHGTPWPVNQAVYVDYMLYGLRGYNDEATEELRTIYRNNQEPNGHVKGYANWGVYTPAMIYTVAQNYLLSGDREAFEKLLPQTLKALDWCLAEVHAASRNDGPARGLLRAPLNDLTGDGVWAFTQAYVYAAFETLGKALEQAGHPRAAECREAAASFRQSVERAFGAAMMTSPLVPLRDHTWTPYVPCEATKPGRRLEVWYPTDVDTGAMHLLRLKALPAQGLLADALLNDHEDNLYLHGWGMANEPVYNPQATAYLLRDDPPAIIRAFYSYMACAFSHSVLEPVEHRWTWGQYFGPPSTDGAWFELYRNMLVRELDDGSLLLLQATPRKWLADGRHIEVKRAPTYYGDISFTIESRAGSGSLVATIDMPKRRPPEKLFVRFRHPEAKPIRSVTVNERNWTAFDPGKEWVIIEKPLPEQYTIVAHY
jgi:hypothetical protein